MQPKVFPVHPNSRMDEQVIAKGIREGSREALGMLWREHSTKMLNLAFRMLKDRDRAEDILMDVFVGIPDAIRAFRGQSALGTWLYRLTVNACLMKLRAEKRHGELEELNLDTIVDSATRLASSTSSSADSSFTWAISFSLLIPLTTLLSPENVPPMMEALLLTIGKQYNQISVFGWRTKALAYG